MMFSKSIKSEKNTIYLKGGMVARHVRGLCVELHKVNNKKGYQDITLDFSHCEYIQEAFMLPILPLIATYKENNIDFSLILPEEEKLERLFKNTNWAHYIEPEKYNKSDYEGGHVPAIQFSTSEQQGPLVDRIIELVLREIEGLARNQLKAFEWSLNEITDNVLQHADSKTGGFVQATAYKEKKQVEFVVADNGMGIPKSLGMESKQQDALQEAINEGRTRDSTNNAGNGLYGSYRIALFSKGEFEINSYHAHLFVKDGASVPCKSEKVPFEGTSVRCCIGFENSDILEKALRFGDKPYNPSYDYLEKTHEDTESNDMILNLSDHVSQIGSREGGRRVRTKLQNLLNMSNKVIVDFSGITVISSSFADEVFGRLFADIGPSEFMKRIAIRNADATTDVLIDRAIFQRTSSTANGNNSQNGERSK